MNNQLRNNNIIHISWIQNTVIMCSVLVFGAYIVHFNYKLSYYAGIMADDFASLL